VEQQRHRDDEDAIRSALSSLKNSTGIPVTMFGACQSDGRMVINQWVGLRTPALNNLSIEAGQGVGGRVMATRRPVGVSDYIRAKSISHEFDRPIRDEGLHSIVAVPVIVGRDMRGVLYAGVHSPVRMGDKVLGQRRTASCRCRPAGTRRQAGPFHVRRRVGAGACHTFAAADARQPGRGRGDPP